MNPVLLEENAALWIIVYIIYQLCITGAYLIWIRAFKGKIFLNLPLSIYSVLFGINQCLQSNTNKSPTWSFNVF